MKNHSDKKKKYPGEKGGREELGVVAKGEQPGEDVSL